MSKPDPSGRDRQFKVLKFLGKGSYGSVFLVQRLADGKTYALKEMDVRSMSQAEREDSINEIRLLASVQHPAVVSYNEAFLDGNRLCIIMEYAPDGDLAKVIKKYQSQKRPLPEDLVWRYGIQVVQGLAALHNMRILHRDIKPGNIMVFDNGVAKIGDLGIAKLLTKTAAAKTQIGTPHYMGPEIWKNRPYSFSSDTWAVGCLLYELAALAVPFEARSMSELRYKVLRGVVPPLPPGFSRELQALVRECLDPNPDKRPSMDAILASPAVQSRLKLLPSETRNPPPTAGSALVETIKVPRGNLAAIKNKLPPAQYATDMMLMGGGDGGGGHGAQMATIDEGSEDDTRPLPARPGPPPPLAKQPPQGAMGPRPGPGPPQYGALPQLPRPQYGMPPAAAPKPGYPPPSAAPSGLGKLPGIGPSAVATPAGGYGRMGAPPPLHAPAPPPSQGGASAWSYATPSVAGAAPGRGGVSESHANYGAFYHANGYSPNSAAAAAAAAAARVGQQGGQQGGRQQGQQQQQGSPWQQGGKWPPQPGQAQGQGQQPYASPYVSPYGQQQNHQRPYANGGGPLPPLGGPRAPAVQASPHGAAAAAAAARGAPPPPWNYGGPRSGNGRAQGGRGLGPEAGGGGGAEGQARVPAYPPPQWAPRPRW